MKTCPDGDRLHAWLDGRVPSAEAEAIRIHSAGCAVCRAASDEYRRWARRLGTGAAPAAESPCPPPATLAALAAGGDPPRDELQAHLAECADCRNDVFETRALLLQKNPVELVRPKRRPQPVRPYGWIAAAAAILLAVVVAWSVAARRSQGPPIVKESAKPKPSAPTAAPPAPELPKPQPAPAPAPEPSPKPAVPPEAQPKPEPPKPLPEKPAPPAVAKPTPEPEKPAAPKPPAPEKPAPVVTRPARRGSLTAIAGACSLQAEGEPAWQPGRLGQVKDFVGTVRIKADVGASKVRAAGHTLWLQRGCELAFTLEEDRTLVRLAKGDALFDVKGAFEVEAPWGNVSVKATRFLVSAEKAETEVFVQRGKVGFAAGGQSVEVSAGERSVAPTGRTPAAAARADVAKRLQWVRALEEFLTIEAEQLTLAPGMVIVPDAGASGGRGIAAKHPVPAGQEPAGELRFRRKQSAPYAVWLRLHWSHGIASGGWVQVHDAPRWTANHLASNPAWQWAKLGVYDLPDEPFRVRVVDPQGGLRFDQLLMTSDLEFNPDVDKR